MSHQGQVDGVPDPNGGLSVTLTEGILWSSPTVSCCLFICSSWSSTKLWNLIPFVFLVKDRSRTVRSFLSIQSVRRRDSCCSWSLTLSIVSSCTVGGRLVRGCRMIVCVRDYVHLDCYLSVENVLYKFLPSLGVLVAAGTHM